MTYRRPEGVQGEKVRGIGNCPSISGMENVATCSVHNNYGNTLVSLKRS